MKIEELIERLEKAVKGSAELDAAIYLAAEIQLRREVQAAWDAPIPLDQYARNSVDWHGFQFTRNLAAARRVVPSDPKGGWFWRVGEGSQIPPGWAHLNRFHPDHCDKGDEHSSRAATAELALCIASLKARSAQQ